MALGKALGIALTDLRIEPYTVLTTEYLGQGAFGVVLKGVDAKKNAVAAKRIDGEIHPAIIAKDLSRLVKLDHPNIMKILDIKHMDNICWIFMPLCEMGDLNRYCRSRVVKTIKRTQIMTQIVSGVVFLHENDIVHRDIKPGNILVASDSPICVKLTDFDVTKFLDPEIETSLMSSNVGTNAFKAPEFFRRNDQKKISYHRSVDVYAAGLTFLAMIQYDHSHRMLVPRIETPTEDSELHIPIGQLVAERIRYKVDNRNIVLIDRAKTPMEADVRGLIRKMTCENPEDRLSAAECLSVLQGTDLQLHDDVTDTMSMIVNRKNQTIITGRSNAKEILRVIESSSSVIKDITSLCTGSNHTVLRDIADHPTDSDYIFESCDGCHAVWMYNIDTGEGKVACTGLKPRTICEGPDDSVLAWNRNGKVLQLKWNRNEEKLNIIERIDVKDITNIFQSLMCYIKKSNVVVMSYLENYIQARKLSNGTILWKRKTIKNIDALTCDPEGRACVVTRDSVLRETKLLVIDPLDGDTLHEIQLTDIDCIRDISRSTSEFKLLNYKGTIKCYNVEQRHRIAYGSRNS